MRVALFTETFLPSTDGVVTRLLYTLKGFQKEGVETLVLAPDGGPEEYAGARVVGFPGTPFYLYPEKRAIWPTSRVTDVLNEFQPDLIHTMNPTVFGIQAIVSSRLMGVPLVASYHTHFAHYARLYGYGWITGAIWGYMRLLHNRAALNLCTSEATRRELERRGFQRLRVWSHGVDLERFRPRPVDAAMRSKLSGGRPDRLVLVFVGRLAPEKQIERLIPLLQRMPEVSLAVVGDGPTRPELERQFRGLPVVFTGYLQGEELANAYTSADAFVFPSTTETLGLVLLEAMASGLPIVAARSAPSMELLDGGKAGLLYTGDDPESLVAVVRRLVADPDLRQRLGEASRQQAGARGWSKPTADLIGFYHEALGWSSGSPPSHEPLPDGAAYGGR